MMSSGSPFVPLQHTAEMLPCSGRAKAVYTELLEKFDQTQGHAPEASQRAGDYLLEQLELAQRYTADLPALDTVDNHYRWMMDGTARTCREYRRYLVRRRSGAPRQYFRNKAHALYFLKSVAPTKLVDGSWLYGLLRHWRDPRFAHLIHIYLEELGEGVGSYNHVLIYKKLLSGNGCDQWQHLSDAHYVQGAIQLCFADQADLFLPELIGFNLGYEQLPLHLLISTYELEELGIDPWYFRLHVTVDNADSGHAWKSLQALHEALPKVGDRTQFYRRVCNGYCLNELGMGSTAVIAAFDMDAQLRQVLARKSTLGRLVHSDSCRIGGRTVNSWLGTPGGIPAFLDVLQREGWIRRHQPPGNSPFWRMIQGDRAPMFGVFDAYEQQLIHDWIAGDWVDVDRSGAVDSKALRGAPLPQRHVDFSLRRRVGGMEPGGDGSLDSPIGTAAATGISEASEPGFGSANAGHCELSLLERQLAALPDKDEVMARLIELMSPSRHYTPPGLMATRIFTRMMS